MKLLDWEYAGMCDPAIDVAMCAIYSYYDETQMEHLLKLYLKREPTKEELFATYAYAALGGFCGVCGRFTRACWARSLGNTPSSRYRYAKKYYRKLRKL